MSETEKRKVSVTRLSRHDLYRITDTRTGLPYSYEDLEGKHEFGFAPMEFPTRNAAEAYAKEHGLEGKMSETEKFRQAQVAYDYREPPEDCDEGHSWRRVRSDGEMTLYRCRVCGKEEVG